VRCTTSGHAEPICIAIALSGFACVTPTTTATTTYAAPASDLGKTGQVDSVREVVRRIEGNPAGGAVAGALIGGILFHGSGPSTLFGAAAGAATGAALSQGRAEQRAYEVRVRFDDGSAGVFDYSDRSPFAPGDRVVVVEGGLARG
jgi:outer membrane lipoprotein SlyB